MDPQLKEFLDRQAISEVVIRYATAVDSLDWRLWRSCFTDEVEIDFTSWSDGEVRTIPADLWVAGGVALFPGFQASQHVSTNHVITLDGDEATCVSYMQAQHYLPNNKGDNWLEIGGYYTNSLIRCDDGWRIRRCQLTVMWTRGNRHIFELAMARVQAGDVRS